MQANKAGKNASQSLLVRAGKNGDTGRTGTGTEDGASPRSSLVTLDVDVGISQVISMLGNRSIVQEIAEGLATDWPIGQPLASRLASPISFNNKGLGFCWQDWPGWPRWHCFEVFKEAVLFVFLVFSSDARSIVRILLSGDFRCH